MIQTLKLDSPAVTREPSQGDPRHGGFSGMLADLVEPTATQARPRTDAPQARSQAAVSREKPETGSRPEFTERTEQTQAAEQAGRAPAPKAPREADSAAEESAAAEQKPPTKASKPRPGKTSPEQKAVGAQDAQAPAEPVTPGAQAAIPPLSVDVPALPSQASLPGPAPGSTSTEASALEALPATGLPPEAAKTPIAPQGEEQGDRALTPGPFLAEVPTLEQPPVTFPPQVPLQAAVPQTSEPPATDGSLKAQAEVSPDKAPPGPAAEALPLPEPKATVTEKPGAELPADPSPLEAEAPVPRMDLPEPAKPIRDHGIRAREGQEAPAQQPPEAALGLRAPVPKPALTELLSRPAPAMEVPSVVQAIQEARSTGASTPDAAPAASLLQALESPRGSGPFQGSDFQGGQGPQAHPQTGQTAGIPSGFSLQASVAAQTRSTPPEALAARPSLPMEQMEGTVRWLLKNDQNTAELQLRPESLGKVQIQLKVEGNQVHAKVWASESTTLPILESHRGMLESSLQEQGLSLGSFDLRQGHGSQHNPMEQSTGQASFAGPVLDTSPDPTPEVIAPLTPTLSNPRRVEVFA